MDSAKLDNIGREAAELFADPIAAPGKPAAPAIAASGDASSTAPDQAATDEASAKEWAGLPFVFGSIVSKAMPELAQVYSEEKCLDWGRSMVPVAKRYGWTAGAAGLWAPLIATTWGFARPTYEAIKQRRSPKAAQPASQPKASADVSLAERGEAGPGAESVVASVVA